MIRISTWRSALMKAGANQSSKRTAPPPLNSSVRLYTQQGGTMKKLFAIGISAILLAGCATTANYEAILRSWVGQPVDNLVSSWGAPQSSFKLSNGGQVLEYSNQRNMQMPGYSYTTPQTTYQNGTVSAYGSSGSAYGTYSGTSTTYVQHQTPGYNIALSCSTRITVNSNGIITNWAWQGNNCKARK